jgi:3-oxoacyl-[acyl-carrier protein] reductase
MEKMKGRTIFVAASTEGLGYAIASEAVKEGARVFIGSRSEEKTKKAIEALSREGTVRGAVLDMGQKDSIERWVGEGFKAFNTVDGVVVNAGGPPAGGFEAFGEEDWYNAFNLTLMSSVRLIRHVLPALKKQQKGAILALTSITVKEPWPNLILSGVMRSGVTSLIKALSLELAPLNIRANCLAPGRILTDRLKKLAAYDAEKTGVSLEEQLVRNAEDIPFKRTGKPEELAKAAVFLLSDEASYITGQTLMVDGGLYKALF